ncbi:MAG: membrane dipeptidase, partial [Fusobacterium sp. JB020]|nr:membrane dipeptidase [Fusobacterium sp. JB020]
MNIFDLHADILFDFSNKSKLGIKTNIFKKYHLQKFKKGNIIGGIFVAWLNNKIPKEKEEEEMIFMINSSI